MENMKKYKVKEWQNDNYIVVDREQEEGNFDIDILFTGSLADCEAWIMLHEKGYM